MAPGRPRTLRLSVADGMAHAVMLGFGESYLGALAVELGHRGTRFALLATVPLLVGALSQLGAERCAGWLGGRKRLVVAGAATQAVLQASLVLIAWWHVEAFAPLLVLKSAFWAAGSVMAPAWNDWIGDLTEGMDRARYLGRRSALVQAALVVAFVAGGQVLATHEASTSAFASIFVLATVARVASAVLLALQQDVFVVALRRQDDRREPRLPWRTALYMAGLWFGAMVSVPFFTPYMLSALQLDYATFSGLLAVSIVAKVATLPLCHRWVRRWGLRSLLATSGAVVAMVPALWVLAADVRALVLVELVGGTAWAGWEYATFQLLLDGSSGRVRMRFLGIAGALSGAAQVAGATLGGQLFDQLRLGYHDVFLVSSALRTLSLLLLVLTLPKIVRHGPWPRLFVRLVSVRPNAGAGVRPIVLTGLTPVDGDDQNERAAGGGLGRGQR